jgi:hypothetical protein
VTPQRPLTCLFAARLRARNHLVDNRARQYGVWSLAWWKMARHLRPIVHFHAGDRRVYDGPSWCDSTERSAASDFNVPTAPAAPAQALSRALLIGPRFAIWWSVRITSRPPAVAAACPSRFARGTLRRGSPPRSFGKMRFVFACRKPVPGRVEILLQSRKCGTQKPFCPLSRCRRRKFRRRTHRLQTISQ